MPQPPAQSAPTLLAPTRARAEGFALERRVDACAGRGGPAQQTVPVGTGSGAEPDARPEQAAQQPSAGGAADVAVGNIAQRLRRNPSRSKSPQLAVAPQADQPAAASGAQEDLRAAEQPVDSSAAPGSAAAGVPEPATGTASAHGQAHAGPTGLADSAAASLAEGACLAPPEAPGQPSAGAQELPCSWIAKLCMCHASCEGALLALDSKVQNCVSEAGVRHP